MENGTPNKSDFHSVPAMLLSVGSPLWLCLPLDTRHATRRSPTPKNALQHFALSALLPRERIQQETLDQDKYLSNRVSFDLI